MRLSLAHISNVGLLTNPSLDDINKLSTLVGSSGACIVRYNFGCVLLEVAKRLKDPKLIDAAIKHIRYGINDARLSKWAKDDPVINRALSDSQTETCLTDNQIQILRSLIAPGT